MEPIRVLQVVTIMNRGGLETMLMNYYRKIDRSKVQFDFMVHRSERGHYDDEIEKLGGKIYRMLPIRPGNYHKYFGQLDKFFHEHKEYKVVHSHMNENSEFVLKAAKKANIPCRIAHSHLADLKLDYKYVFRIYARMNLKDNITDYFTCSKRAGEWLFGKEINNSGQVITLNNAVDSEKFQFNNDIRNKVRKELGIEFKKVIGHVGRFNPQKNHEFLVDVFNEIHKKDKNTVLLLVGEGDLCSKIKEKVKLLGIEDSVKFLGVREDISDLMQAMDLFLFPSLFEGLAVVLVEAQAAGLKCITSTGVTEESNICGDVEFIDLNLEAKVWADKILKMNWSKSNNMRKIIESGYDAATNVKFLTKFYLDKYKEERTYEDTNSVYAKL